MYIYYYFKILFLKQFVSKTNIFERWNFLLHLSGKLYHIAANNQRQRGPHGFLIMLQNGPHSIYVILICNLQQHYIFNNIEWKYVCRLISTIYPQIIVLLSMIPITDVFHHIKGCFRHGWSRIVMDMSVKISNKFITYYLVISHIFTFPQIVTIHMQCWFYQFC